jgi:hypothetical protein
MMMLVRPAHDCVWGKLLKSAQGPTTALLDTAMAAVELLVIGEVQALKIVRLGGHEVVSNHLV